MHILVQSPAGMQARADYSSKEGANDPKLLVAVGGATPQSCSGTATATSTPGATNIPTAGPSPTPTNTSTPTSTQPPQGAFNNATFVYDGDGKRVKSTFNGTTTTYFVGNHYEVTGSTITKYYYAGAQRIAMRTNGTLNYLLGDHLGSTSLITDSAGNKTNEQRYKAWGETRYTFGNEKTKYQYTGQFSYTSDFGLYFYNARWYDPALGRFSQADSIVPAGIQGYDRYAYVNNNPIRYNDPTGHICSDPEDENGGCESGGSGSLSKDYTSRWLRSLLKDRYDWNVSSDFSEAELNLIYQAGLDIENYVNGLTGGLGQEWMNAYLGGTSIVHGASNYTLPGWIPTIGDNTIFLQAGGYSAQTFVHELGHIWDINSGRGMCACGAIGGVGDSLNTFIGGSIASTRSIRYDNYSGKPANPNIPSVMAGGMEIAQFNPVVNNGYGNGSTADYLAEAFSWNVIDRQNVPIMPSVWVDQTIISQAQALP